MNTFMKNLITNGVSEKTVRENEVNLIKELLDKGIIYVSYKNGKMLYKVANNVVINPGKRDCTFEVIPNRYIGIVFEYDEIFDCVSRDKAKPEIYCATCALNPDESKVKYFNLGDTVRVKVLARGYDIGNEGLSIRLPRSEEDFYELGQVPCITIGLANGARPKNTMNLNFDEPITSYFIEGRKALVVNGKIYYSMRDIDVETKVYLLEERNGSYALKEQANKKLIGR